MTVSYQYDVASSTSGGFTRLLFKWKGSLYKLIYRELFLFCLAYGAMACVYRLVLTPEQKKKFNSIANYCNQYMNYIPLSFILGFYVSFVAQRWWNQYMAIPWPDKLIHAIALHVSGYDEKSRMMRRTLARYINLSLVLILRSISSPLKKRFPTLEHLVDAGFITTTELGIYKLVPNKEFNTYWVPCTWFTALLKDVKAQKRITDTMGVKHIMEEFSEFRSKCGILWGYDWVSIPLVYTQVVTLATYAFFLAAIIGRQFIEEKWKFDGYVPFFTILQFFFYMGLLKVAEQLINPFGDDDEDFELNWIIDRHMKVSYLIVDTLLLRTPPLTKDIYFDNETPVLPYTEASAEFKKRTYKGSVANMVIPEEKQNLILPDILEENEDDDRATSVPSSMAPSPRPSLLGGKESRSVSLGEEGAPSNSNSGSQRCPTPSPHSPRRGSGGSQQISRSSSRRLTTAGSEGIGVALLAVGAHQGFLGADPEKLSAHSTHTDAHTPTQDSDTPDTHIPSVQTPDSRTGSPKVSNTDSVTLEMGDLDTDRTRTNTGLEQSHVRAGSPWSLKQSYVHSEPEQTRSFSFRLPASLKARIAVRKKPVITWRPYVKEHVRDAHGKSTQDSHTDVNTEGLEGLSDLKLTCPGCFEDECAFMWRTIEGDSDSEDDGITYPKEECLPYPHSPHRPYSPQYYTLQPVVPLYKYRSPSQTSDQSPQTPDVTMGSPVSPPHRPPRVLIEDFGPPWDSRTEPRFLVRRLGQRRARYRTKCRTRCIACSLPLLPVNRRNTLTRSSLPVLVRSLSESSVLVEGVLRSREPSLIGRNLAKSTASIQSPRLNRHRLSLPIVPHSKPSLNGKRGFKNSPSPES